MSSSNIENIPWTEKYRPNKFDDIVLDPTNKKIFLTMLKNKYFPNLLLYGPPGTGKTTTVINLINEYQKSQNHVNKSLVIHLNASDERGIDTIRNQIYQFVRTKNLFETGYKFVVLDEVDYMTKNAQQALRYLLQNYSNNFIIKLIQGVHYITQKQTNRNPPHSLKLNNNLIIATDSINETNCKQTNLLKDEITNLKEKLKKALQTIEIKKATGNRKKLMELIKWQFELEKYSQNDN